MIKNGASHVNLNLGSVLDGKKDMSKKDRTANAGRIFSVCFGLFRRVLFLSRTPPISNKAGKLYLNF